MLILSNHNLEQSGPRPKSSSDKFGDDIYDINCGYHDIRPV